MRERIGSARRARGSALAVPVIAAAVLVLGPGAAPPVGAAVPAPIAVVAQEENPQPPEQTPGTDDPVALSPWLWALLIGLALVGAAFAVRVIRRNPPTAGRE